MDFLAGSHTVSLTFFLLYFVFFLFYIYLHPPRFPSHRKTPGSGSPDSVLKKSLLPSSSRHPPTSSATSSSSSSQTDCSSFSTENQHWDKQPPNSNDAGLSRTTSYPVSSSSVELISRGSDGRFLIPPDQSDAAGPRSQQVHDRLAGFRRSLSLRSEKTEDKEPPFVLSVDLPPCSLAEAVPSGRFCGPAQHLPRHGPPTLGSETDCSRLPRLSSVCSNGSLATIPARDGKPALTFPVLPHIRRGLGQPATNASALVLQMEHEREKGNLSHCLKLAQERVELERELQTYTLGRKSTVQQQRLGSERRERGLSEVLWEYKSRTLPHRHPQGRRQRSALSSSDISTPPLGWEPTGPDLTRVTTSMSQKEHPAMFATTGPRPHRGEPGGGPADRWTLPHRSPKKNQKGCDNSPQSALSGMQTSDSRSEQQSSLSPSSRSHKRAEPAHSALSSGAAALLPDVASGKVSVEMSVDEPELEESTMTPLRPPLHHRMASHVQQNQSPPRESWYEHMRSIDSFTQSDPPCGGGAIRSAPPDSRLELSRVPGSRIWNSALRSRSLDLRRRREEEEEEEFLTPDAWINSLSQENCSLLPAGRPGPLTSRMTSKSPTDCPSTSQPPPTRPFPSPEERSERLKLKNNTSLNSGCQIKKCGLQGALTERHGSSETLKNASRCVLEDNRLDVLEMDGGGFEVVPQPGSYSSYASSGRGSMDPANGRLSLCHLGEENQERTHDEGPHRYLCRW